MTAFTTAIASGLTALLAAGLGPVPQDTQAPSPSVVSAFEEHFEEYGVPEEHWAGQIEAIVAGENVEAQSGAAPASVEPFEHDGLEGTIERWSDGSFHASLTETPVVYEPGEVMPMTVSECSTSTSAGVTRSAGCLIQDVGTFVGLSYRATFSRWASGSEISRIWDRNAFVVGGSWSLESFSIHKARGYSNSNPAWAQLTINANITGWNTRVWLRLNVGNTSAWTTENNS